MAEKLNALAMGKIAEVQWEDTVGRHSWQEEAVRLPVPEPVTSVGYVLQDDEGGVVLLQSFDHDPNSSRPYGCQEAIPRSAIRKVKYLRGR